MKNAYQILGVESTAPIEDIKKEYRRLSQEWHPDKNPSPRAGAMFAEISTAWKILSDSATRQELDDKISKNLVEDIDSSVRNAVQTYLRKLHKNQTTER